MKTSIHSVNRWHRILPQVTRRIAHAAHGLGAAVGALVMSVLLLGGTAEAQIYHGVMPALSPAGPAEKNPNTTIRPDLRAGGTIDIQVAGNVAVTNMDFFIDGVRTAGPGGVNAGFVPCNPQGNLAYNGGLVAGAVNQVSLIDGHIQAIATFQNFVRLDARHIVGEVRLQVEWYINPNDPLTKAGPFWTDCIVNVALADIANHPILVVDMDISSPTSVTVGATVVGQARLQTVTLKNVGDADLNFPLTWNLPNADFAIVGDPKPTLAPGESTTFTVRFSPSTTGLRTWTAFISSDDPDTPVWTINFNGQGLQAYAGFEIYLNGAKLTNGASSVDFGVVDVGTTATLFFSIHNNGNSDLRIVNMTRDGTDQGEFSTGSLPAPVPPNGWSTLTVSFTPTDHGAFTDSLLLPNGRQARLRIWSNVSPVSQVDPSTDPFNLGLTGKAKIISAKIEVHNYETAFIDEFASGVSFGAMPVGRKNTRAVTICNELYATADLTIIGIAVDGKDGPDFTVEKPAGFKPVLKPGECTTFLVHFQPRAPSQPPIREAWVHIQHTDRRADFLGHVNDPFDLYVNGEAEDAAPKMVITEIPGLQNQLIWGQRLDFGHLLAGQTRTRTFTVTNIGSSNLVLGNARRWSNNVGDFDFALAPRTLAPDAKTTFTITFRPGLPAVTGQRQTTFDIENNDLAQMPFRLELIGHVDAPEIVVEQPAGTGLTDGGLPVDFGAMLMGSSSVVRTFTVKNQGNANLTGLKLTTDGAQAAEFIITQPLKTTIALDTSTTFTVRFNPKGAGTRSAALHLASNDADESSFDIALLGEGVPVQRVLQGAYVKASNGEAGASFGYSMAISGNTMVVGARYANSHAGAAYVFVHSGGTWNQQAILTASNAGAYDGFGASVAVSGDVIVVGAYEEDSNAIGVNGNQGDNNAISSGAAYVFVRSGSSWSPQAYLKASNTGEGDFFGCAVAVSGETVVVGAAGEDSRAMGVNGNQGDNNAISSGAAYVFVRNGNNWSQQAYIKASNPGGSDSFGISLAVSGETVVVGAIGEASSAVGVNGNQSDNSASDSGAAYVFMRTGNIWSQQAYLKESNTDRNDNFGTSVAVDANTIVVSATAECSNSKGVNGNQSDNGAPSSGAAYVFLRTGNIWSQQAYLKASNTDPGDNFGFSVAVDANTIVVSASAERSNSKGVNGNQSDNSAAYTGAAYVFMRTGNFWNQQSYLKASNTWSGDFFGYAVAVAGDLVAVGAPNEESNATTINGNQADNSAQYAGAVYVFNAYSGARLVVEQPAGIPLAGSESVVYASAVGVGQAMTMPDFQLRNTGGLPLTGLSARISGTHAADFVIVKQPPTLLAGGAGSSFAVRFSPKAAGDRTATLQIFSNDAWGPFIVTLTGIGLPGPGITGSSRSTLQSAGMSAVLMVMTPGSPTASFQWQRNGVNLPYARAPEINFPLVKLTDAGVYVFRVTDGGVVSVSEAMELAVVDTTERQVIQPVASTVTLEAHAVGSGLSFVWWKGGRWSGQPLVPDGRISGMNTAKLTIRNVMLDDAGEYSCSITPRDGMNGSIPPTPLYSLVVISSAPALLPRMTLPDAMVGASYLMDLPLVVPDLDVTPSKYTATGLPPGLVIDSITGAISGLPTMGSGIPYMVTITASNTFGSRSAIYPLWVALLPYGMFGVFNGLVARDAGINAGLGGSVTLTVAPSGAFSGKVILAGVTNPISGQIETTMGSSMGTASCLLPATASAGQRRFAMTFDGANHLLTGVIGPVGVATGAVVRALRNPWYKFNPTSLDGTYTAALELPTALNGYAAHPQYPQGNGYSRLTVSTTGIATWSGVLADGTPFAASTTLGLDGSVPLHVMLYTPTVAATAGSVQGWVQATPAAQPPWLPLLDGTVDWIKNTQAPTNKTRSYKAGFPLHSLMVIGGRYVAPAANTLVLGLADSGLGFNNAKLVFSEGDIVHSSLAAPGSPPGSPTGTLTQALQISTTNVVTISKITADNPGSVSLILTTATGAISGSFTLKDNDPTDLLAPIAVVTRTVPWSGVLVPRLSKGVGQFQLPQLPNAVSPVTTAITSPQLSGQVVLEAGP